MITHEQRLAAARATNIDLVNRLIELDGLKDRLRKAQLIARRSRRIARRDRRKRAWYRIDGVNLSTPINQR